MSAVSLSSGSSQSRQENLDKLLKQLLECIQQSQKRYGGKNELATEFDSCVAGLCLCLEAVFLHGVRAKPQISQVNSTLKQVSDIVVQSLHIGQDSTSFWPFIQRHLTNHEKERYVLLKHIWTDIGKCRAWIRATLNEKSLERYFHTLLGDKYILAEHYESWALLRDEDKNSMLPNMAAGLGSILFAMSIDKPEFNSSIIPRTNSISFCVEPIIKAPIPENIDRKRDQKKKRRVARQFISFDDDMLSTSVPSVSSSSTCSDASNSGNLKDSVFETMDRHQDESVLKEKHHRKDQRDQSNNTVSESIPSASQNDANKPKMTRKLSIENSGSREKFTTTVPESLTPINHNNIGELTPVSVERIKDFEESPDISDDILEVPTDISAVLTAVENKNSGGIEKKVGFLYIFTKIFPIFLFYREEKINLLTKENENLKEQVKKYVEAIQMLRRDDEPLQKALDGLQIEKPPDYKVEAKIYEQKLVQVAEMHAELMDFNVALQQSLCKKDTLLEKLKNELEDLKGPISMEFSSEENTGNVNVWIPSAFLTGSGSNSHHVYQVYLRAGNDEWNIYRRYAQFHALHTDLKKLDPIVGTFDFPPKKSIGKKDSSLVEDRRKRLQVYLRRIIDHWPELAHCASRFLLEQHLAFFKDQRDEEAKKNMFNSRRNTGANHSGL
ncbi:sorting nexin-29 isoform X2 [Sitophilus oryzae]|nr:sorting nexin-29 isoform X2 [Sitophilus oryzae]XP_030750577.1 sorting nexin-29 isoform X2 [Sitophilus oryzae]